MSSTSRGAVASRSVTTAPSPGTRATIRTVVRSGDTRPASGGAFVGSAICSKTGPAVPPTVDWNAASRPTMSAMVDRYPGSSTVRPLFVTTTRNCCDAGVWLAPAFAAPQITSASPDSDFDRSSLDTASTLRVPPATTLPTNRPIVATNHSAATGHRCRALHAATRTVHGRVRTCSLRSDGAVGSGVGGSELTGGKGIGGSARERGRRPFGLRRPLASFPGDPDLFGRPLPSPLGRDVGEARRRALGGIELEEILDVEGVSAEQPDPVASAQGEVDRVVVRPLESVEAPQRPEKL